jgi:hypothetical protein
MVTAHAAPFDHDLLEIYNGDSLPVDLGGLYLTDNPSGWPNRHRIPALSFVAGGGMSVLIADGDAEDGPEHTNFKLDSEQGMIGLFAADLQPIDVVLYGPQRTNVSQGRSPNGAGHWEFFAEPNFGGDNPFREAVVETVELFPFADGDWQYNQTGEFSDNHWTTPAPGETDWVTAAASFYNSSSDDFEPPLNKRTRLSNTRNTHYFRKAFAVPGNPADVSGLLLDLAIDDGAVVYLNGHEVLRISMPAGAITYNTRSNRPTGWETEIEGSFNLDQQWLQAGDNVLAVEVHQHSGSTDMGFDAQLRMERRVDDLPPAQTTITGTNGPDTYYVVRAGSQLFIYENTPPVGPPTYTSELAAQGSSLTLDTLDGDDSLVVDTGTQAMLGLGQVIYHAGSGANTLVLKGGSAQIDSTADVGTLNTTVQTGALLSTRRLMQNELTLEDDSAVILTAGGGTSVLAGLALGTGARLDVTDNALIIDYRGPSPLAAVRDYLLAGRGGGGFGQGWNSAGIVSSTVAEANLSDPESRSVGYAENALLSLGAYSSFRGQAVDDTSILIAYTRTADANLDGVVNDDDVTIVGATYAPGISHPSWALGDFDYNGLVDDDDATLIGAFYDPSAAAAIRQMLAENDDAFALKRKPSRARVFS